MLNMKTELDIIYGPGGYDPTKPNNNIISSKEVIVPDFDFTSEYEQTTDEKITELQSVIDQLLIDALEKSDV